MNNANYHYAFTSFDVETFDLEDFMYNDVNMTAYRLLDKDSPVVQDVMTQMEANTAMGRAILNQSNVSVIKQHLYMCEITKGLVWSAVCYKVSSAS
jgi:hypothetical protein